MINYKKYCPVDAHNHVWGFSGGPQGKLDRSRTERQIENSRFYDLHKLCVSVPLNSDSPTPEEFRASNDIVMEAMKFSEIFMGFCFLNPGYARESLAEIDRCIVRGGMSGIKLYHQYLICDPALRPVMDYAAELGVPVLMHAGKLNHHPESQPRLSNAEHFLKAVRMFPQTTLIQGHIGGGGDWEWNLRVLEALDESAKYYIDTGGSVVDAGIVRRTVAALGEDRVLFATDGNLEAGVGKVLDAGLSEKQLRKVFSANLYKILSEKVA